MNFPSRKALLLTAVIAATGLWLVVRSESPEQRAANETRRKLKEAGFKTDLDQFDFSAPLETRTRVAPLTNNLAGHARRKASGTASDQQFQQA